MVLVGILLIVLWVSYWMYCGYLIDCIVDILLIVLWVSYWLYCGHLTPRTGAGGSVSAKKGGWQTLPSPRGGIVVALQSLGDIRAVLRSINVFKTAILLR